MLLAAVLIGAALLLVKLPLDSEIGAEPIVVQLLADKPDAPENVPDDVAEPDPSDDARIEEIAVAETPLPTRESVEAPRTPTDWREAIKSATSETVTAMHNDESLHPGVAEAKRLAGINIAPSRAPVKKPIWENVETDQMGRTVLRNGDCYRVLDDWRATYQDIQRDLGQYIMYCDAADDTVIDVKWVAGIRQKYAYLRHTDGEIPQDEIDAILRRPLVAQE